MSSQSITSVSITMELVKEAPAVVPTERPLRKQSGGLFLGRGPPGESNFDSFKTIRILHLLVIDLVLFFYISVF